MKKLEFTDKKSIYRGIARVKGSATNLLNLVQAIAVGILVHDKDHNDCSAAKDLVAALPLNNQAPLIRFFAHFGNIGMNMNDSKASRHITADSGRFNKTPYDERINQAKVNAWHSYDSPHMAGVERPVNPITIGSEAKELLNLTARMRKRIEEGGTEKRPLKLTDEERTALYAKLDQVDEIARDIAPPEMREEIDQSKRQQADDLQPA